MMLKRGQATGFVIAGILVVAIIVLLLYLRGQLSLGFITPTTFDGRLQALRTHVEDCLQNVGEEPLRRIGLQGGHLKTPDGTFRLQEDIPVSYLCYNILGDIKCQNRLLTRENMQNELAAAIKQDLSRCIDLGKFKGRVFDLTVGSQQALVDIGDDSTTVTLKQPVTLKKDTQTAREDTFSVNFNVPLGRLYETAEDIIDVEAEFGEFEQLTYMLAHRGEYVIEKKRPYPDKLYILRTKDSDYIFQFFIQDEPSS